MTISLAIVSLIPHSCHRFCKGTPPSLLLILIPLSPQVSFYYSGGIIFLSHNFHDCAQLWRLTSQAMEKYTPLRQSMEGNSSQDFSSEETVPLTSSRDEFIHPIRHNHVRNRIHLAVLYSIIGLLSTLLLLLPSWIKEKCIDPSIGLWSAYF